MLFASCRIPGTCCKDSYCNKVHVKYFYTLQFDCVNTLQDQLLENVKVDLVTPEGFTTRAVIPCPKLVYGEKDTTYVIVEFPPDVANSTGIYKVSSI